MFNKYYTDDSIHGEYDDLFNDTTYHPDNGTLSLHRTTGVTREVASPDASRISLGDADMAIKNELVNEEHEAQPLQQGIDQQVIPAIAPSAMSSSSENGKLANELLTLPSLTNEGAKPDDSMAIHNRSAGNLHLGEDFLKPHVINASVLLGNSATFSSTLSDKVAFSVASTRLFSGGALQPPESPVHRPSIPSVLNEHVRERSEDSAPYAGSTFTPEDTAAIPQLQPEQFQSTLKSSEMPHPSSETPGKEVVGVSNQSISSMIFNNSHLDAGYRATSVEPNPSPPPLASSINEVMVFDFRGDKPKKPRTNYKSRFAQFRQNIENQTDTIPLGFRSNIMRTDLFKKMETKGESEGEEEEGLSLSRKEQLEDAREMPQEEMIQSDEGRQLQGREQEEEGHYNEAEGYYKEGEEEPPQEEGPRDEEEPRQEEEPQYEEEEHYEEEARYGEEGSRDEEPRQEEESQYEEEPRYEEEEPQHEEEEPHYEEEPRYDEEEEHYEKEPQHEEEEPQYEEEEPQHEEEPRYEEYTDTMEADGTVNGAFVSNSQFADEHITVDQPLTSKRYEEDLENDLVEGEDYEEVEYHDYYQSMYIPSIARPESIGKADFKDNQVVHHPQEEERVFVKKSEAPAIYQSKQDLFAKADSMLEKAKARRKKDITTTPVEVPSPRGPPELQKAPASPVSPISPDPQPISHSTAPVAFQSIATVSSKPVSLPYSLPQSTSLDKAVHSLIDTQQPLSYDDYLHTLVRVMQYTYLNTPIEVKTIMDKEDKMYSIYDVGLMMERYKMMLVMENEMQMKMMKSMLDTVQQENASLKDKVERYTDIESSSKQIRKERDKIEASLAGMKKDVKKQLLEKDEEINHKNQLINEKSVTIQRQNSQINNASKQNKEMEKSITELKKQLIEKERQINVLSVMLDEKTQEELELTHSLDIYKNRINEVTTTYIEEKNSVEERLKEKEKSCIALNEKMKNAEIEYNSMKRSLMNEKQKNESIRGDLESAQNQLLDMEKKCGEYEHTNTSLLQSAQQQSEEIIQLTAENAVLKNDNERFKSEMVHLVDVCEHLMSQVKSKAI